MRVEDCITLLEAICDDLAMVTEVLEEGELRILWANDALCAASGYRPSELIGQSPAIFAGPAPDPDVVAWLDDARAAGQRFRGTLPYHRKDGSRFWGDLQLSPWIDCKNGGRYWVSILRDITPDMELRDAFKKAKQEAVTAQERLWSAIEAIPDAFVMFDAHDRMVMCNTPFRRAYAMSAPAIAPGNSFEAILRYGLAQGQYEDAKGREEEWLAETLARHADPDGPIDQRLPGNRHIRIHEVKTPSGDTVGFRTDITELKRQQQAIERHARALAVAMERAEVTARTDMLTGLANRRGLDLHMRTLAAKDAERAGSVGFLHIDLDRFKLINDTMGHAAGDQVLREVAGILRASIRPADHIARVGGDEFAIVIETGPEEDVAAIAHDVAARVIEACRTPVYFEGRACHYGASIGIAIAGPGSETTALMENADLALYQAKETGRNRAALYAPALRHVAEDDRRLADDLRAALEEGSFEPWFQPILGPRDGEITAIEVLRRWRHPERGILTPADYQGAADDLDIAVAIDLAIFEQALTVMEGLYAAGLSGPRVALNVNRRCLVKADLDRTRALLATLPWTVSIELLEADRDPEDNAKTKWRMDALRQNGAEIEIDNFGTGHASITTLLQLRPDRIKLAPDLVATSILGSPDADAVLRSIADMTRALGIGLVARGVDTPDQAAHMDRIGCMAVQGRVVAPEMQAADLGQWLAERGALSASGPSDASIGAQRRA